MRPRWSKLRGSTNRSAYQFLQGPRTDAILRSTTTSPLHHRHGQAMSAGFPRSTHVGWILLFDQFFFGRNQSPRAALLPQWAARPRRKSGCEMIAGSIGMPSPRAISEENKPIRLIFVDDDDDYREAATAEIVDLGFVVESFADGASMLASVVDGLDADVIVLDCSMPTISGIELLPRLRREGIRLPVVFLTGRSAHSHEHLAFDR